MALCERVSCADVLYAYALFLCAESELCRHMLQAVCSSGRALCERLVLRHCTRHRPSCMPCYAAGARQPFRPACMLWTRHQLCRLVAEKMQGTSYCCWGRCFWLLVRWLSQPAGPSTSVWRACRLTAFFGIATHIPHGEAVNGVVWRRQYERPIGCHACWWP